MKKIFLLTITTLFLCSGISAQTDQGYFFIGGDTNFNMTTQTVTSLEINGDDIELDDVPTTTSTNAGVDAGYFIADNLAIGAMARYTSSKISGDGYEDYDPDSTTSFGALLRYYIGGIAFVQAGYGMTTRSAWKDLDDKPSMSNMGAGVGACIFLTDEIAFTPKATYDIITQKLENYKESSGVIGLTFGITVFL